MANYGGWAGKILRVNLTTGKITAEDTMKYKDYLGGMGLGYKVMFDEVPIGTKAYDEANKIIFGIGPLTGSGALMSSRVNITSLMPTHNNMIGDSHMGGHWGPELKYAGWDGIIIEGKAKHPVWLRIENDNVTIEDARWLWGNGIYRATQEICNIMGAEAKVAAIGQAGENMVNMSVIMNSYSHSAGGHGGVMGSKNLKAIGVRGTLPVRLACSKEEWKKLDEYVFSLLGSNNQHVVPRFPQPWAEFTAPTRWWAKDGLYWGAANPPVNTGTCHPEDKQSIGYRCQKAYGDLGPAAEKYTVRMGGCQSCPIRCHGHLKVPQLEKYGYSPYIANTCGGWAGEGHMLNGVKNEEDSIIVKGLGKHLCDDFGIWNNYGLHARDFEYAYKSGKMKEALSKEEWDSIPWHLMEAQDPAWLVEYFRRIAFKEGEFSRLGEGSYYVSKAWNFGEDYYHGYATQIWNYKLGFPKHHSRETAGQVGALQNCFFNRDPQTHTITNLTRNGLPHSIQARLVGEIYAVGSPDALDPEMNYKPMNIYKAKWAKWGLLRNCLHDSLTLCNWMWPLVASPHKSREYRGDTSLEAQYYSLATGDKKTEQELDEIAERIFNLHRCYSIMQYNTTDMRTTHDSVWADWIFDYPKDKQAFTPGTDKLDREDMQKGLTMFYEVCGWDQKTGIPLKATLERLGLHDVAREMEKRGLLPA